MNRFTTVACFGIATLLLMTTGPQSAQACLSPRQESVLNQIIPSLEVKQGDVRDVIRKLFKTTKAAYTIAPEVQGGVSVSLKNVTFEAALQNVLKQVDSTYRIEGGVINIVRFIGEHSGSIESLPTFPTFVAPPRPPASPEENTSVVQDAQFLYIIRGSSMFKVRKSDMKVVAKGKLPC